MGSAQTPGQRAHEVVGLYGDPDSSWAIVAEFGFAEPLDPAALEDRLARLCAEHPHLGAPPPLRLLADADWHSVRGEVAVQPFAENGPLLRVCLHEGGCRLLVGAHHGVVDGLGLVAVAAAVSGSAIRSHARGIRDQRARRGFLRASVRRGLEALFAPPGRFPAHGTPTATPAEDLSMAIFSPPPEGVPRGTAALAFAVVQVLGERGATSDRRPRAVLVVGASRRIDGSLAPDRCTAFLRVPLHADATLAEAQAALAAAEPEPDFPETSIGGIGPKVTHLLRGRLGATALLSNLGQLDAPGLDYVAMFPAASGPRAVAVGLATTPTCTSLTLHTRRAEFDEAEHADLLAALVAAYTRGALGPDQ